MRVDDGSPPMRFLGPRDDLPTQHDIWNQLRTKARKRTAGKRTAAIPPSSSSAKKPKNKNDFGGGTFWNRPPASQRRGQQDDGEALSTTNTLALTNDLIVDNGASHVLFQERYMHLLDSIQLSSPSMRPYAILRAANGQELIAIGRGIFRVKAISVVAYIFRNENLVHNLLGIAPFADCGCTAVFTATSFELYHHKLRLLTGTRHSANLWHISLDRPSQTVPTPTFIAPVPAPTVLLLHENTRRDKKYVQFIHACLGSPPPTTFLKAIERGYLNGEKQFPRLTSKMVRKFMPSSLATAKGHSNKTPTARPHALFDSVSARR
jgi:hypothetical protein